jgi:Domain of unknown function (DUF4430)
MQRTHSGRPAHIRLTIIVALLLVFAGALAVALRAQPASAAGGAITVRVEGITRTLVPVTRVTLPAVKVVKDGKAADSCSASSAAAALQSATHGNWKATWSASYKAYFVTTIAGLDLPSTGAEYWAFWVNDAPASQGICGYDPKPGDSILFFPDCYGKTCPKSGGVLGLKAPSVATVGSPVTVSVTAYSDAKGTPSKAVGAKVSGGGATATTAASGTAKLSFTHPGKFTLTVSAPHAVRAQAVVCVQAAGAKKCG